MITYFTKRIQGILATVCLFTIAFSATAQSGHELKFVKVNAQFVTVPHSSSLNLTNTAFTMEAFVNYNGSNSTIIDKGDYDYLWQLNANSNGNKMGFYVKSTGTWVYSTGAVAQNRPQHVAITFNGGALNFFINGVPSGAAFVNISQDALPLNIGRQQPSACQCNHFNGTMDEVRIWNITRTPAQIQANMQTAVAPNSAGLVAYYKFDEGSGTTTADATTNGNNGTLVNGPTWLTSSLQYNTPGSFPYTVPAGVQSIRIQLWGAGAAGAFDCNSYSGGGGAFVQSKTLPVIAGQVYSIVIGNGGQTVGAGGEESYVMLGGNKVIGAFGGTLRYGQAAATGPNVEYSYAGGNAGTNYVSEGFTYFGGGGASGGTTGAGGNGSNASGPGTGSGGQPSGIGGTGGNGGTLFNCAQYGALGGAGASPGSGGGAPFFDAQLTGGGNGRIVITQCYPPGSIVGYTKPFPYENSVDSVYDASTPSFNASSIWEQSTNNSTWTTAPGNVTSRAYPLQVANPPEAMYYRRVTVGCGLTSNAVLVTTYTSGNGRLNGTISGKVFSKNNVTGVDGITITIQKTVSLLGSPITKTYTTVTAGGGLYEIPRIFYGNQNDGDPIEVEFTITPTKDGHRFNVFGSNDTIAKRKLSANTPSRTGVDFTDNTVYAINGTVTQVCSGCLPGFTTTTLDSVRISAVKVPTNDPAGQSYTGDNGPGGYGITLTDPGTYKLKPEFLNHTFSPTDRSVTISNSDINDANFVDNTVRTVTGVLRANGGAQIIGSATLEFTDTVKGKQGVRFKKRVDTDASGAYSIGLPARHYKARIVSFNHNSTAGSDIPASSIDSFFNVIRKDSMIVNLDSFNRVLNFTYHRTPVIQIIGLPDSAACIPYVVFQQGKRRSFTVNVWEGNPVHNYKLPSDSADSVKIILATNVHIDNDIDSLRYNVFNGVSHVTVLPGPPNLVVAEQHRKPFRLVFKDRYGRRAADITRETVVLGVKSDPGKFATVSPQVPLLILHDPPGDLSFAEWAQSEINETAVRFSALSNESFEPWIEAKLGVDLILGLGVSYQSKFWASINASFGVSKTINEANEAIMSIENTRSFSTSGNSNIIGDGGDVYVGAALNFLYSEAHELKFKDGGSCDLEIKDRLMLADDGFGTQYVYSESHIINTEIPRIQFLADNTTGPQKAYYEDQISIWQQVIAQNAANKARSAFDKNISFDGTVGAISETTTATATKSQTIEFNLEVKQSIAMSLGLEIAGSGVSGGVNIGFRMETGKSRTTTSTKSTTISYTIDDDDDGDNFTVDVRKDPVYGTPVFALLAGQASCPDEPIAQKRDNAQVSIPIPVKRDLNPTQEALFELKFTNTSDAGQTRDYYLFFDQKTNPFPAASITINGSPYVGTGGVLLQGMPYNATQSITIGVTRNQGGDLYSYEGLKFYVTDGDACGGNLYKSVSLSAYFATSCSPITITSPTSAWQVTSAGNNILPVVLGGYTVANLQSISFEHSKTGTDSWKTDTTILQGQINGSTTPVTFRTDTLLDGAYDLRAKVTCANAITYSQRISGMVDRTAPLVFGIPQPTDDNYVTGDMISYTYNENIETLNLASKIELRRMSNNALVPLQVSGYQNKIMIVPTVNIASFTGDTMRLIMNNIADVYGNARAFADTTYFAIGTTIAGTTNVVTVSSTKRAMNENAAGELEFRFTLPSSVDTATRQINYIVSGSATFGEDYTVLYNAGQPPTTNHNGVQGAISVLKKTQTAILRIKPVADNLLEPNETITVTLIEGGDYTLGAVLTLSDTIRNDDLSRPVVYKSGPLNICQGQTLNLSTNNTIDGQPVVAYLWKNGATNVSTSSSYNVTASGVYTLTVYHSNGFTGVSEPIEVSVSNVPGPSLGADVTVYLDCPGDTKNISSAFNTTGLTTTWNTANPNAAPAGVYRLVAANNVSCTDTAYVNVVLETATWTGAISSDWHNAQNWNIEKVPSGITHVIVATGTPNVCVVGNADANAASVQTRSGATVNVINNKTLTVGGKCLTLPAN